jgi:hypothetical protein
MRYEVVEEAAEWLVVSDGAEVARFNHQDQALAYVAGRLRDQNPDGGSYSLTMRYQARS